MQQQVPLLDCTCLHALFVVSSVVVAAVPELFPFVANDTSFFPTTRAAAGVKTQEALLLSLSLFLCILRARLLLRRQNRVKRRTNRIRKVKQKFSGVVNATAARAAFAVQACCCCLTTPVDDDDDDVSDVMSLAGRSLPLQQHHQQEAVCELR